jgi:hypothetical protein
MISDVDEYKVIVVLLSLISLFQATATVFVANINQNTGLLKQW